MARTPLLLCAGLAACAATPRPFPVTGPLLVDTDLQPVSVECRPDPSKKEPDRQTCAPAEYVSPFVWDQVDKFVFEPLSRALFFDQSGEADNANSLDEVADSAWFTNRVGDKLVTHDELVRGQCKPEDMLPLATAVKDGEWVIDHGKDNGSTLGFRVTVPGKGLYLLKADDKTEPERASAASAIGASLYNAVGFNTSCEQVVMIRKEQLKLTPGLTVVSNAGISSPFDDAALDKVLASTTQMPNHMVRMQASKWLDGLPIGPFKYTGTRPDDPNDTVPHEQRRELRGGKVLAAWLNHWDAREQNSMDVWEAQNPKEKRSSPGFVRHYIIDTSETLGGDSGGEDLTRRLGDSYAIDLKDTLVDFVTFGAIARPWDGREDVKGRERFHFFSADLFDPEKWKTLYPNPAFGRMSERDAAWMARKLAHFSPDDVRTVVSAGQFQDPTDADYITRLLLSRQRAILKRYLTRLSPLGEVHVTAAGLVCATDFARLRLLDPEARYRYEVVVHRGATRTTVPVQVGAEGQVCFQAAHGAPHGASDGDPSRLVRYEITNGTAAGPLVVHTYDLDARGTRLAGVTRSER